MYNGIGLTTVRGSGTSGYVQTNKFNLRNQRPTGRQQTAKPGDPGFDGPKQTKANDAILEHNRKREIERQLLELEDSLIEKGLVASHSIYTLHNCTLEYWLDNAQTPLLPASHLNASPMANAEHLTGQACNDRLMPTLGL